MQYILETFQSIVWTYNATFSFLFTYILIKQAKWMVIAFTEIIWKMYVY